MDLSRPQRQPGRNNFERFVLRASPALLRSAYVLSHDRDAAEDLLQATLARVARRWDAIEESPDAFAHRVLVNLSRDRRRNSNRRPVEVAPDDAAVQVAPDIVDNLIGRESVTEMVRRLPAKQREVVVLRFLLDLSVRETANALRCSEGTVKSHSSRALATMRTLMGETTDCGHRTEVRGC